MAILTGTVSFPLAPVPLVLSPEELVHPAITKLAIMARVNSNKRIFFIMVSSECYDFVYTTHLCPIERSIVIYLPVYYFHPRSLHKKLHFHKRLFLQLWPLSLYRWEQHSVL